MCMCSDELEIGKTQPMDLKTFVQYKFYLFIELSSCHSRLVTWYTNTEYTILLKSHRAMHNWTRCMCRSICVLVRVCVRTCLSNGRLLLLLVLSFRIVDLNISELQVAEYLVPSIRSVPANGSTKPTYIRFLTGLKAYSQIFSVKWKTEKHNLSLLRFTCSY